MPPAYDQIVNLAGIGYTLYLQFACQGTQCFLTALPKKPLELTWTDLAAQLNTQEITVGVDQAALENAAAALRRGEEIHDLQIAQGNLPAAGQDAYLEYKTKPFSFEPNFNQDQKGQIDFRITHLFENAKAGDVIALEHPALPGKHGQTVLGKIIPAPPWLSRAAMPGAGVDFRPETHEYVAKINGRVLVKDNILTVTEEFLVEGDVDYKTGHISFVGFVHVRGDVLDGFNVCGRKGVKVYNNIGNSNLSSDGDIDIGGMTGRDTQAQIRCQGRLRANYLYNVEVECADDIYVKREIMHCKLRTNGAVYCSGRIVGGSCLALAGIEAAALGSEFGIKTFLCAGLDFHLANTVQPLLAQLKPLQKRWLELSRLQEAGPGSQAAAEEAEFKKISAQKEKILQKLSWIYSNLSARANAKINVFKELHAGTLIQLGRTELEFKQGQAGPNSLIEVNGQEIQCLKLSPLSKPARELEEELLARSGDRRV